MSAAPPPQRPQRPVLSNGTAIPEEVLKRALWRWGPQDRLPEILRDKDQKPFDPDLLFWFPKKEISRGSAWSFVYGKSTELKVKDEKKYKGWRKCHTENYWAWYAHDLIED